MKRRRSKSSPFLLIEERMATLTNTSKALWKTTEIMGGFPIFDNYEDGNMWRVKAEGRQKESATERQRLHLMRLLRERRGKKKEK